MPRVGALSGNFRLFSGNFRQLFGNRQAICLGPFQAMLSHFRQFRVILGHFGGPKPKKKKPVELTKKVEDCTPNILVPTVPGEERVYTTTAGPLFSRSVARPRGHRAKKAMVSFIFLGKKGKRVYTIGPERRVYTIEPQTQKKKKKEGLHGGGVYFFLPCSRHFKMPSRLQSCG